MDITSEKWMSRMLTLAHEIALWSKDNSTKVGAVITTEDGRPMSWGFNGFPIGISDNVEARHERPMKYKWMAHAEQNAIDLAPGNSLQDGVIFVTFSPCSACARSIIQNGIKKVVVDSRFTAEKMPERWQEDMLTAVEMLGEAGVEVIEGNIIE